MPSFTPVLKKKLHPIQKNFKVYFKALKINHFKSSISKRFNLEFAQPHVCAPLILM